MHASRAPSRFLVSPCRSRDPIDESPKNFGFVEFEDAEGVLRAIRYLNGLKVDGQELLIKGNSATQKYIEDYEQAKVGCSLSGEICINRREIS
jgi:RNA recognition motif-containing protein